VKPMMKYMAIHRYRDKYPIKRMCEFFGVSRSGYYSFYNQPVKMDKDKPLVDMISECQRDCGKTYGYRRVHIWLERNGVIRNRKTVYRIMNKYGLLSTIRRRRKYVQMSNQMHIYSNTLNRDFRTEKPNQKWVTDISYIHTAEGVLYLSIIKDLYDNSIVSHKIGTEQTVNLVLNTVRTAREKETVTAELQLHSDQGFQYTSREYFNLTQQYGIFPSMSRRGNCYDNAPVECFFSIIKSECIRKHRMNSFDEARNLIDDYIHFYNHERIQLKTKLTPFEKRRQFV